MCKRAKDKILGVSLGRTAASADLAGSHKFSNESFEDWSRKALYEQQQKDKKASSVGGALMRLVEAAWQCLASDSFYFCADSPVSKWHKCDYHGE